MIAFDYDAAGPDGEPRVVHVDQEWDYRLTVLAPYCVSFVEALRPRDRVRPRGLTAPGRRSWRCRGRTATQTCPQVAGTHDRRHDSKSGALAGGIDAEPRLLPDAPRGGTKYRRHHNGTADLWPMPCLNSINWI